MNMSCVEEGRKCSTSVQDLRRTIKRLNEFNCLVSLNGNVFSSLGTDALEDIDMRRNEVHLVGLWS